MSRSNISPNILPYRDLAPLPLGPGQQLHIRHGGTRRRPIPGHQIIRQLALVFV